MSISPMVRRAKKVKKTKEPTCLKEYLTEQELLIAKVAPKLKMALVLLGVAHVSCEYSGGGDDGQMGEPFICGKYADEVEVAPALAEQVQAIMYALIDCADYDWCNNDGGGGTVKWDLATGEFGFESAYYNVQETKDASEYINMDEANFVAKYRDHAPVKKAKP